MPGGLFLPGGMMPEIYEPTRAEIRAACEKIRESWTAADYWARSNGQDAAAYWEARETGAKRATRGKSTGDNRPADVIPVGVRGA